MFIKFDSELFHQDIYIKDVSFLLAIFSDNYRHDFLVELTEVLDSKLFNQLSLIDQNLLKEYFSRYIREPKREVDYRVSLKNETEKDLNFEEAKRFFNQPYLLILENNLNDGYFVDAIIKNFKSRAKKINISIKNDWFIYSNGGGCSNIANTIEANKKRYELLPKANHKYLRCFVLLDSDKKYPNEPNTQARQNLFDYLEKNDIKYHQLYKREIENYLPYDLLKKVEGNEEFIKVYERLPVDVKDFIDLENGFPDKNRESLTEELADFYQEISDNDFNFLRKNSLKIPDYKSEFPKLFLNSDRESLKDRIKHQKDSDEFENLLSKLTTGL
ncbi:hypothetical protein ATE84_4678 [Aquimarina sp. MAR_2010_214]|uniref:hypothetical protein n=1 Tax=Aquimarina sp. MAR_2010_214 TaxID=1250026 RepID=UPI000C7013F4|nr:hypothetical protein [Aquimarina sp. MAR_2010_214]PKV52558.1 hypothetical protein ATE84_4678 [Aquimarina sp. MAR_2010_214]